MTLRVATDLVARKSTTERFYSSVLDLRGRRSLLVVTFFFGSVGTIAQAWSEGSEDLETWTTLDLIGDVSAPLGFLELSYSDATSNPFLFRFVRVRFIVTKAGPCAMSAWFN